MREEVTTRAIKTHKSDAERAAGQFPTLQLMGTVYTVVAQKMVCENESYGQRSRLEA